MRYVGVLVIITTTAAFGQQQPLHLQTVDQLLGKRVVVQRMPLCQPGTYNAVFAYAGKQAKVVSIKSSNMPKIAESALRRMTPETRAMMEDSQKAATVLFEFDDGTRLDSCAPFGPASLSGYLELADGESLAPTGDTPATAAAPLAMSKSAPNADLLTDEEVKSAIGGNGRDHWVEIQDMGLMAAQGNQVPTITLYMPDAVLAIQAESAKKQFLPYQPSEEEKRQSLMVVAQGYTGKTITEGCTSITRIVLLSDPSGKVVKEAYLSEPLAEVWKNNFGGTNHCQSLRTKFDLNDVMQVKAAARDGEFFIAVFSGPTNTKMYKIKKKHQAKLGLK